MAFWHTWTDDRPAFIRNPYFLLALALLSLCLLVDQFYILSERRYYVLALLCANGILFVNFRYWQASLLAVVIAFISFAQHFPRQPNHDNILTGVMLAILFLGVVKELKKGFSLPIPFCNALFRTALVAIYILSGFHKLNTDFFNACSSCANLMGETILGTITGTRVVLPASLSYLMHLLVILMEMFVPFGLLHHRTRKYAAIALLGFHFFISFYSYSNFSAMMVFLLFGSLCTAEMLRDITPFVKALRVYIFFAVASLAITFICIRLGISSRLPLFLQGLSFNIGMVYFAFVFFKHYQPKLQPDTKNSLPYQIAIVVVLGIWSLKTYAGLGNAGNLTMFSNLVTESSRSNHLLIDTKYTKLNNLEEDNVLVLEFNDSITNVKINGMRLPKTEFCYRAANWCMRFPHQKIPATILYKGDTIAIEDLHHSPFSKTKWWYKYIYFRPFPDKGPSPCNW